MPLRPTINSSILIEEVKRRPCLYDNRGVHGNYELKNAAWGEIGAAVFKDKWSEFSLQDKDALVKDLQTKWKSLRDNYSRQLRLIEQAKSGTGSYPNKKYIFMDQLSFLSPFINKREKFMIATDESKDSNDSMFSIEDQKPSFSTITVGDSNDIISTSQTSVHFVPIQPKPTFTTTTLKPVDINTLTVTSESGEPPYKKVAKCLEELVAIQKEDRAEDTMGNKKFLLSLLPFMKKLPDDVNLEVRLQLMSVLQTYSGGKGLQS